MFGVHGSNNRGLANHSLSKVMQVLGPYGYTCPRISVKRICFTLGCFGYSSMTIFQNAGEKSRNLQYG